MTCFQFIQKYYENEELAAGEVRKGKAWGSLAFSHNYSESLKERTEYGQNVEDYIINAADLNVQLDMSSKQI